MDEAAPQDSPLAHEELIKVSAAYEVVPGDIAQGCEMARTFLVRQG
ncbi:hypothetical protein [Streptomyces sp. ALI-76-A]|jgi:hypothetical protein|nr:hypothetical protein [Streptomyces sp. ALI-76-A]MDL5199255.1 hypothetical protein [Streptomyces sp. ALI-76-A]